MARTDRLTTGLASTIVSLALHAVWLETPAPSPAASKQPATETIQARWQAPRLITAAVELPNAVAPINQPVIEATQTPKPAPTGAESLISLGDNYLPRNALTVAPRPMQPVVVDYPEGAPLQGARAEVSLFIDELGIVRRVRAEGDGLSPIFEHAVREAFAGVHFSPGEVAGQPVKARIRIEVEFSVDSIPPPQNIPAPKL